MIFIETSYHQRSNDKDVDINGSTNGLHHTLNIYRTISINYKSIVTMYNCSKIYIVIVLFITKKTMFYKQKTYCMYRN